MTFAESENVELKRSLSQDKEGLISISAILNKNGKGKLYFGIDSEGKVTGLTINDKTLRDVEKLISDNIEPKIYPLIQKREIGNKYVIEVDFQGVDTPYSAYGKYYIRVADSDKQMTRLELKRYFNDINTNNWDNTILNNATINDISEEKLKIFAKVANLTYSSKEQALENLGLIRNGKLTNSAIIIFGQNVEKFFSYIKLSCATFASDRYTFIDKKEFSSDIIDLIEIAQKYILEHINVGVKIVGTTRVEIPEIDAIAIREAVINAFCHRDYTIPREIQIAIYKDSVKIISPGTIYKDVDINEIKNNPRSLRRNEKIAEILHIGKYVERFGTGIRKILKVEPKSEFESSDPLFISILWRKPGESEEKVGRKLGENLPIALGLDSETIYIVNQALPYILVGNELKVIRLLRELPNISVREMSSKLKLSDTGIEKILMKLKQKQIIERVGPDKGGYWKVKGSSKSSN